MARGTPASQGRAARSELKARASQTEADERALKDPKAMAAKAEIQSSRDNYGNEGVSIVLNGESLQGYGFSGRYSTFGKDKFDEIFHEMDASLKDNLVVQMMDKGMDKKDAIKAVDLMAEKASTALFGGKPNFEKSIQDKAVQSKIETAFKELDEMVARVNETREAAKFYSDSPSDDGSYNIEAAVAAQRLENHVKYVNRLRDEISSIEVALQFGEKTGLNRQTKNWMERLVYGGALDRAVQKHRDLFVD